MKQEESLDERTTVKDRVLKEMEKQIEPNLWIDVEVNKATETTMQTLSYCNVFHFIEKTINLTEKLTLERMLKIIDKVVRGEKTSIDILREELKSNLEGGEK